MKVSFPVGSHRIDCVWLPFGRETYFVDGKPVLRIWSLANKGARSFELAEGGEARRVTVVADLSRRDVTVQVSVDGNPLTTLAVKQFVFPLTFIEVAFVVAIIGILAAISIPPDGGAPRYFLLRLHTAVTSFEELAPAIVSHRERSGKWPSRNADLGLPEEGLQLEEGRHHFQVQGDGSVLLRVLVVCKAHETHCKPGELYYVGQVSFRPAVDASGGIRFLCGHEAPSAGYSPVGENRSTLRGSELPKRCR